MQFELGKGIPADQRLIPLHVPGPAPPGPRGQFFTSTGEIFVSLPISPWIIPLFVQICWHILGRDQTCLASKALHICTVFSAIEMSLFLPTYLFPLKSVITLILTLGSDCGMRMESFVGSVLHIWESWQATDLWSLP